MRVKPTIPACIVTLGLVVAAAATASAAPVATPSPKWPGTLHPVGDPFVGNPVVSVLAAGMQFTEGPMWNESTNELVFTDLSADRIYRSNGQAPIVVLQNSDNFANGIEASTNGSWVVCEHRSQRVRRRQGTQWTTIASTWNGQPFNSPNDNVTRADGTVYFTDPTFGSLPEFGGATPQQGFQGVYRIAPGGSVHLVDANLQQPNGIALNAAGTRLYVTDTQTGAVMRYVVASDGTTGSGVRIATVPQPDGLTLDTSGHLYIAAQDGVRVLEPSGAPFGTIAVPEQPSNVGFGGKNRKRLFITARTSVYYADLEIAGVAPPA